MSLLSTVKVTLKDGLTEAERAGVLESLKRIRGIADAFNDASQPNVIYSNHTPQPGILDKIRALPHVVAVESTARP